MDIKDIKGLSIPNSLVNTKNTKNKEHFGSPFEDMYYYGVFNKPIRRKLSTYIKSFISKGDQYFIVSEGRVVLFEIVSIGNQIKENNCILKIISDNLTIDKYYAIMQNKKNRDSLLGSIDTNGLQVIFGDKWELYDKNSEAFGQIVVPVILGLFKEQIINDKKVLLPDLDMNDRSLLRKEYVQLFEPCFDFGGYIARKMKYEYQYEDLLVLGKSKLMADCISLDWPIAPIFYTFKVPSKMYLNNGGESYEYYDVIKELHHYSKLLECNLKMISYYFASYWQKQRSKPLNGFSKNEIKAILDDYFYIDVRNGFYCCGDTLIHDDSDELKYLIIDKKSLSLIYAAYQKKKTANSTKDLHFSNRDAKYISKFGFDEKTDEVIFSTIGNYDDFETYFNDLCKIVLEKYNI